MAEDITEKGLDFIFTAEKGMGIERLGYSWSDRNPINGCLVKGIHTGKLYAVTKYNEQCHLLWDRPTTRRMTE